MHRYFYFHYGIDIIPIVKLVKIGLLIECAIILLMVMMLANFAPQVEIPLLLRTSELLIG